MMSVAIIGAGAAGLSALHHLNNTALGRLSNISAVAFEQGTKVGGTWIYTDSIGKDQYGLPIHSSMYKNLRTNLPKECMGFPDFKFCGGSASFVKHEVVQEYLENYSAHFDLSTFIKFQTQVKWITPVPQERSKFGVQWEVTTSNVLSPDRMEKHIYDAVLLCNGHYSIPHIPTIPGQDTFPGHVLHSHNYRKPDPCKNKTILILGAHSSGQDIAIELSTVAKKVYLSHNNDLITANLPENIEQRPGIVAIDNTKVMLSDGSNVHPDVLLYCTGYHYDVSFLSPDCGIKVHDGRITPLYKHIIHTKYPNFGMIGICKTILPFPLFDMQVRFYRAVLDGALALPSEEAMNADTEVDYQDRLKNGFPHRYAHVMGPRQFNYNKTLADLANTARIPETTEILYKAACDMRKRDLVNYKQKCFSFNEASGNFQIIDN